MFELRPKGKVGATCECTEEHGVLGRGNSKIEDSWARIHLQSGGRDLSNEKGVREHLRC